MDTTSVIGYACVGIFFWFFVNFTMKAWYRRKEGTGKEVDLSMIGHRGAKSGGDIEPNTITKLEKELKEQAK